MRRLATIGIPVTLVAILGWNFLVREPVIVTGPDRAWDAGSCSLFSSRATLVAGSPFGTMIRSETDALPVVWPAGYTLRRDWLQVQVLDPAGNVVAITGKPYGLFGSSGIEPGWNESMPGMPQSVFYACSSTS